MLYCVPLCSCGNCDIRHMVTWITPLVGEDKQMQGAILQGILCQQCCHQDIFCRSVNLIRWPDIGQANMDQTEFAHFEQRSIIWEEVRQVGKAANGQVCEMDPVSVSVSQTAPQVHNELRIAPGVTRLHQPVQCDITMYCNTYYVWQYYNVLPKLAHLLKQRHSSKICKTKSYKIKMKMFCSSSFVNNETSSGGWQGKCDL